MYNMTCVIYTEIFKVEKSENMDNAFYVFYIFEPERCSGKYCLSQPERAAVFRQIRSYYKNALYTKFGQLVFRNITEIVVIRCQILRPKCTKFETPLGELTAPRPPSWI